MFISLFMFICVKGTAIFNKGDNFCDFLFAFLHTPSEKGSTLKGGSKFFPFRVDSFSEGKQTVLTELPPLNMYQFP